MLKNTLIKFLRIFWLFWGCGGIFSPRNSRFILGILEFPTMSSSGLTRGSHHNKFRILYVIARGQSDRSNL